MGVLNDQYIRFLVWLGAEPPPGYEHLIGAEASPREYIVKTGDTLFSVARKFNVHYEKIAKANGFEPSASLQAGQKLLIPPANWDPANGPLTQLQPQPAPALDDTVETPPPVQVETAPEAIAPIEEAEPFVELEPDSPPLEEAAPVVAELDREEELVSELPDWLRTPPEAEEVVAPPEQIEPEEVTAPPLVTRPVEFEPEEAIASPLIAHPVEVEPEEATAPPLVIRPVETEPAPALPVLEPTGVFRYEVQRGDTLNSIANRYDVGVAQLLAANDISESDRIFPGQKLIIPGYIPQQQQPAPAPEPPPVPLPLPTPTDQFFIYTMTRGDTLNSIANRYGVSIRDIIEINQIETPDHIRIGQQLRIPTGLMPSTPQPEPVQAVKLDPPPSIGLDPTFPPLGPAQAIRALYVSYFAIGHPDTRQHIFDLLDTTELNAVVLDVKGDDGWITYPTQVPLAHEIGADRPMVKDFQVVMDQFKARRVYTIARIVTFKDSLLAKNYPEYAVKMSSSAEASSERDFLTWTDPFLKPIWDYNLQLAVEAAQMGFDEIHLSHVRFPSPSQSGTLQFSQEATKETRVAAITGFLSIARGQLRPYGVRVSADVLGYTCWRKDDSLIGQDIERMGQYLDVLCPMLYPSTFGSGIPGYKLAIAHPYEVVSESAQRAVNRVGSLGCAVRPWIQDFPDYRFDKRVYGKDEIQAQIKACFDAGSAGFMVWDHRVKYTTEAYAPASVQA